MKTIAFTEEKFTLMAPMEGPDLGKVVLNVCSNGAAVLTLDELDVLRDRLAFVHTSIEHIQKHGLLPVVSSAPAADDEQRAHDGEHPVASDSNVSSDVCPPDSHNSNEVTKP